MYKFINYYYYYYYQGAVPCGDRCRCIDCKNQMEIYDEQVKQRLNMSAISAAASTNSSSGNTDSTHKKNNNSK